MKLITKSFAFVSTLLVAGLASAAGVSDMAAAVSFTDVVAAVLAIGALLIAVYVAIKGAKIVLTMVKGG